jgi:hypothetical protein
LKKLNILAPGKKNLREILESNRIITSNRSSEKDKNIITLGRSPFYHSRKIAEAPSHEIFTHPQLRAHLLKAKAPYLVRKFVDKLKNRRIKNLSEMQHDLINDQSSNVQIRAFRFKKKIDPRVEVEKEIQNKKRIKNKNLERTNSNFEITKTRFNIHNYKSKDANVFKNKCAKKSMVKD